MSDTMRRLGSRTRRFPRPLWVGILLAILWGVYFGFLYPWFMNWGATSTERQMALPGDPPTGGLNVRSVSAWKSRPKRGKNLVDARQ